jgi:hypothetical protein
MTYVAGAASVSITPDFSNFHKKIGADLDKEDASFTKAGDRWGKLAADGFKARFKAADMPTAKIKADADTAEADAKLDKAARNRTAKIKLDASWLTSPAALIGAGALTLGPQALGLGAGAVGGGVALGAAAAGVASFAAVAVPMFSKITKAQSALTTAQQQYDKATTAAGRASALKAEAAATAGLTSSEKSLAVQLTGLTGAWHKMQAQEEPIASAALLGWFQAARTAVGYFPKVFEPAASAIGDLGDKAKSALQAPFWGKFFTTLGKTGKGAITGFGDALGHVGDGFAHLFVTFAPDINKLPGLIDKWAASFDNWATHYSRSGFDSFMKKTFSAGNVASLKGDLQALGTTLGNVAKATANLSPAAFGGLNNLLTVMAKLSPGQIEAIGVLFGVGKTVGGAGNLAKLLSGPGSLDTGILGSILGGKGKAGKAATAAGEAEGAAGKSGLSKILGGGAADGIVGLLPAAATGGLLYGLSKIKNPDKSSWLTEGPGGKQGGWNNFGQAGRNIGNWTAGAPANWATTGFSGAYTHFQRDFAGKITSWFTQSLPHAFSAAGSWLTGTGSSIASGLVRGWNAASGAVTSSFGSVRTWAGRAVSGSVNWLRGAGNGVATGLVRGWNGAGRAVSGAFGRAKGWAVGAVSTAGGWLHSAGNAVGTGLVRGWNGAGNATSGAFRRARSWATSAVSTAGGWLRPAGNVAASGLVRGWGAASGAISGAFGRASSWAAGAFRGAGGWLVGAGESIMNGLAAGLNWGIGKVQSILNWVTAHIPSWKGPPAYDAVMLKPAGQLIMGGLQNSLAAGIPGVRGTMQDATAAIAAGLRVPALSGSALSGSALRGGDGLALVVSAGSNDALLKAIVTSLRYDIQAGSGGDVQKHLGRGKART